MKYVLASIKHIAIAAGLLLGASSSVALAASTEFTTAAPRILAQAVPTVSPTPVPTPTVAEAPVATTAPATALITIRGVACIDQDLNGLCAPSEARVPNVIVRGPAGAVAITDSSGQYALQIAPGSQLYIAIPAGFKSANGSLNHLFIQLSAPSTMDIALALDNSNSGAASTVSQQAGGTPPGVDSPHATSDSIAAPATTAAPTAFLEAGSLVILALAVILALLALVVIRLIYLKSVPQQNLRLDDEKIKALGDLLLTPNGWQTVAGQIVADALNENISVDEDFGILNAANEPAPRFTVVTRDRRVVMFTTGLAFARKARMIRKGDRVVDITRRSVTSHAGAGLLWQHAATVRNMDQLTPPSFAHWYIIAQSGSKAKRSRAPLVQRNAPEGLRRLVSLLGGRSS
ncbi:MAG: hypothetical protein M1434_12175 [Chloroflexi bacterium]|nr:hypothetical protein [Chloroflexota bacterium]MCL5275479.1 hypothetical protein [Chloroflexota bacterium]